jgi:hypothetical protein
VIDYTYAGVSGSCIVHNSCIVVPMVCIFCREVLLLSLCVIRLSRVKRVSDGIFGNRH